MHLIAVTFLEILCWQFFLPHIFRGRLGTCLSSLLRCHPNFLARFRFLLFGGFKAVSVLLENHHKNFAFLNHSLTSYFLRRKEVHRTLLSIQVFAVCFPLEKLIKTDTIEMQLTWAGKPIPFETSKYCRQHCFRRSLPHFSASWFFSSLMKTFS